jgi:hypothetical protein
MKEVKPRFVIEQEAFRQDSIFEAELKKIGDEISGERRTIFISRAWPLPVNEDRFKEQWVNGFIGRLVTHLQWMGFNVSWDNKQAGSGVHLDSAMKGFVDRADHILCIITHTYLYKVKNRPHTGVALELAYTLKKIELIGGSQTAGEEKLLQGFCLVEDISNFPVVEGFGGFAGVYLNNVGYRKAILDLAKLHDLGSILPNQVRHYLKQVNEFLSDKKIEPELIEQCSAIDAFVVLLNQYTKINAGTSNEALKKIIQNVIANLNSIVFFIEYKSGNSAISAIKEKLKRLIESGEQLLKSVEFNFTNDDTGKKHVPSIASASAEISTSPHVFWSKEKLDRKLPLFYEQQSGLNQNQAFINFLNQVRSFSIGQGAIPKKICLAYASPISELAHEHWIEEFADNLAVHLIHSGLQVFQDKLNCSFGQEYKNFMKEKMKSVDHIFIIVSETYLYKLESGTSSYGAVREYFAMLKYWSETQKPGLICPIMLTNAGKINFLDQFFHISFHEKTYLQTLKEILNKVYFGNNSASFSSWWNKNSLELIEAKFSKPSNSFSSKL